MKILTLLCFIMLIVNISICAQEDIPYRKIEPIEPTTASLGKYGEYNINYSNGLPDIFIPIYKIQNGSLSHDITLRYHGGGIKVNEDATWVGLGWDLFFGGTITRQVNGLPDEEENFANVPNAEDITQQMKSKPTDFDNVYFSSLAEAVSGYYSFQQDVYHFNFGNYSGKFVLDNNSEPMLIPHSALQVYFELNGIAITSPEGVKYFFGPYDKTEIRPLHHYGYPPHITSWHLERIVSPNFQDTIRFEYQEDGYIDNRSFSMSQGAETIINECIGHQGTDSYTFIPLSSSGVTAQVHSYKPKYIYFKNGRICFSLSERSDIYTIVTGKALKKLDYIEIQKKLPDGYKTFKYVKFNYTYFNDGGTTADERLKLLSISEIPERIDNPDKITTNFNYYDNKRLCAKTSYSTDFWGYYNGVSNSTPIPRGTVPMGSMELEIGGADKTPNEEYMTLGSLKGITYPTGGHTEFEWEMNRYGDDKPITASATYIPASFSLNPVCGEDIICSNRNPSDSCTDSGYFSSKINQYVTMNTDIERIDKEDLTHRKFDKARITITDLTTNSVLYNEFHFSGATKPVIYLQKDHNYFAKVVSNCNNIIASLSFTYDSYDPLKDQHNYPIGGLRIKTIKNYDMDQTLKGTRNFKYINPFNGRSSGAVNNDRTITYSSAFTTIQSKSFGTLGCTNELHHIYLYHSNPTTGIYSNSTCYEYVTEYFNDNLQGNGYTEYQFRVSSDDGINESLPLITMEWNRGQLLRQTTYKYANGTPAKVSETINQYTLDPTIFGTSKGFKMLRYSKVNNYCSGCNNVYSLSYVYGPLNYQYYSQWLYLSSSSTTNFNSTGNTTTTQDYTYYNPEHCKPNRIVTSLRDGKNKIEINKYPNDYTGSILNDMKAKHMISYPIEQQVKIGTTGNEKIISGIFNEYAIDANKNLVLDKVYRLNIKEPTSSINDGATAENRYTILKPTFGTTGVEYDEEANLNYTATAQLQEVITHGQNTISYQWGYNNAYPVVKAENCSNTILANAIAAAASNLETLLTNIDDMTTDAQKNAWKSFNTSLRNAFPANTMVYTYTYKPLLGMTSHTDPNGITTYYEYDDYGRLKCARDNKGNVLKNYEYHYKQ